MDFYKVAGSSPKARGKGAMVKGECFLPLKTRKAPEIKDFIFYLKQNEDLQSKSTFTSSLLPLTYYFKNPECEFSEK